MTGRHWVALATLGAGFTTVAAMTLYAKGRKEEAFALAFTASVLSTVFAAARVLEYDAPVAGAPAQPGGMDSSSWGMA